MTQSKNPFKRQNAAKTVKCNVQVQPYYLTKEEPCGIVH